MEALKKAIREVPDFPKEGILFYDITTLLKDGKALAASMDALSERYKSNKIDAVLAIEARGYILGATLAYLLGTGFIPVRKPGKLPAETIQETYDLEYGTDTIEMHADAVQKGHKILVVDDLLATGGTAAAACQLVEKAGGKVVECCFLIELSFLNGREKLGSRKVFSLLHYDK